MQTVFRSSQFVDDIKRLRKAGGLVTTTDLDNKHGTARVSDKVISINSEGARRTDYPTSINLNSKNPAAVGSTRWVNPSALTQEDIGISAVFARAKRTIMTGTVCQREGGREVERELKGGHYHVPNSPPKRRLPRPQSAPAERTRDDVERLRRVVREAMSLTGKYQVKDVRTSI